ncbi:rho GTPase-activating protein 39 isoform X1 [Lates japonicus]|uniref:Rho GTPase-activating protein 39 isoform X1 n=1 Tax=Lates japonicus TaxID=270547 RepID=A0AAD3NK26_LATJO|nr:rho GTPase-activating protein 39 isoform X1 [Lates japonicus]
MDGGAGTLHIVSDQRTSSWAAAGVGVTCGTELEGSCQARPGLGPSRLRALRVLAIATLLCSGASGGGDERQSEPRQETALVQVQLSQYVLALGGLRQRHLQGARSADEVNALKLQVDQWRRSQRISDPNVLRHVAQPSDEALVSGAEETTIPMNLQVRCNCDDPVAAIARCTA